ncbi:MAG: glycosyltransferase family 4 protein [Chloroflexi bacterium]|nr:glycosyltransferase family 4 protein [Chloroflexota bacterium]
MIAPTSFFADYGCHVRILEEILVLQKMGNRITLCTYHNGQDVDGLDIRRTASIPWRKHYEVGSSRHKIAFDGLLGLTTLATALRTHPDIIHAHLHEGALIGFPISRLRGVPLVFDFQGSLTGEMIDHRFLNPNGAFYRPMRRLEEWIDHLPDAILTSSQHATNLLISEFNCTPENISIIPDCVNPDTFTPQQSPKRLQVLRAAWSIPTHRKTVVYLGLLAHYQGTDLLLEAAAILRRERDDVHFLIMGYPAVDQYQAKARRLGLDSHVTFTGKIPYSEAPQYLALGDVAVAPKMSATEGSGKILNYMAMALPTVAFDVPVSREYLADLGLYAQPGDAASLAERICYALDHEEEAKEIGCRLRQRAIEHYSWDRAGKEIMEIYHLVRAR